MKKRMERKRIPALLLSMLLMFSCVVPVSAAGNVEGSKGVASAWTAEDFLYGEMEIALYPAGEYVSTPNFTLWVVTGLSEAGTVKLETNKDLVIPATDADGKKVQGIGNKAFYNLGITSLSLPENVKASYDDSTWETTGKGLTERGDFFIGSGAFQKNALTTLKLPEGVIYVGGNAFNSNQLTSVKLPKTIMMVGSAAFGKNSISFVDFPKQTDFAFQADIQAFAVNKLTSVQIPANTEKLNKYVFFQNTGMEPITIGTAMEKKGGLVYMYKAEEGGQWIDHLDAGTSNVQKLIIGAIPWEASDFTYDDADTTITGLSDVGKAKLKVNPDIVLPEKGPSGEAIVALGDGTNLQGIFVYAEDGKNYTPSSVLLPDTLTKIGKWTFALNASLTYEAEMATIALPDGLLEIGQTAFQNSKLTSVSIPDSVTTMGSGAFTGSGKLTSVKLSKNVTDIPTSAFNAGSSNDMKLENLEIPEGVQTIGNSAFTGTHVEKLSLPSTLTSIGSSAFQNHQLTEVTIPGSVKEIGTRAFKLTQESLTKALTKVVLNEGLQTIKNEAFAGNKLTEIALPSTVTSVGKSAFENKDQIVVVKTSNQEHLTSLTPDGTYTLKYVCPPNGHVEVVDEAVKATCEKTGLTAGKHCSVCGAVIIAQKTIEKVSTIKLSKTALTYNGKTQKVTLTVKDAKGKALVNGKDYTVSGKLSAKSVGKYTVKVTLKGNYSGSKSLTWCINPKKVATPKVTAGKKSATVKFTKVTGAKGYVIQYSTDKKFKKGVKSTTVKTTSKKITKLTGKKTYYFRVRAYGVDKTTNVGAWSTVKSAKIKK